MSFYNTGNPVPSIDPRDLDDNAKHIDEIVNSVELTFVDRKGVTRLTLAGMAVNYANIKAWNGKFAVLDGALASLPENYDVGASGTVLAIGRGALGSATQVKKAIAIGPDAMGDSMIARDSIAIGDSALKNLQARTPDYSQTFKQGTRIVALGGNAGYFAVDAYGMVLCGRNAGHCVVAGHGLVALGLGAVAGYAPVGLSGQIENGAPWGVDGTAIRTVGVGLSALTYSTAFNVAAVGGDALANNKKSENNVALGPRVFFALDSGTGFTGGLNVTLNIAGTYSQAANVLTLNFTASGVSVGDKVRIRLLDGASQTFEDDIVIATVATIVNANSFTVNHPISRTASGTAHIYGYETAAQQPRNEGNTGSGVSAGAAFLTATGITIAGNECFVAATSGTRSTGNGYRAGRAAITVTNSLISGSNAALNALALDQAVALGDSALRSKQDGSIMTETFQNIVGLGYDSRVSGANQLQLGNTAAVPYAHAALQIRSDERDKIDFRKLSKAIELIRGIEWFEFRKNERSRYVETVEKDDGTFETVHYENDGSRAGNRFHAGAKAQQIQQLCETLGLDWAGLQHHAVTGGLDIYTVAYEAFIPYMGECIQHLLDKSDEFESRLSALEAK